MGVPLHPLDNTTFDSVANSASFDANNRSCAAFVVVVIAASATAIGSSAVFYPALAGLATTRILCASLGFASGVMLYVSLVDIYSKAIGGFREHGHSEDNSFIYTTLFFFAGILFMKMIDLVIKRFTKEDEYEMEAGLMEEVLGRNRMVESVRESVMAVAHDLPEHLQHSKKKLYLMDANAKDQLQGIHHSDNDCEEVFSECQSDLPELDFGTNDTPPASTSNHGHQGHNNKYERIPVLTLDKPKIPQVNQLLEMVENGFTSTAPSERTEPTDGGFNTDDNPTSSTYSSSGREGRNIPGRQQYHHQQQLKQNFQLSSPSIDLVSMGASTATAIALHNFPEGLVTFIAYVENPAVGMALAISIAVHNIPEGLCVALAFFYGSGNRWKAFFWGTLCCFIAEPAGALFAWVVLRSDVFSGDTSGILYGMVAGMMVFICLDELLPMAFKFDPQGTVVTWSCLAGMTLVAVSLMLFKTAF